MPDGVELIPPSEVEAAVKPAGLGPKLYAVVLTGEVAAMYACDKKVVPLSTEKWGCAHAVRMRKPRNASGAYGGCIIHVYHFIKRHPVCWFGSACVILRFLAPADEGGRRLYVSCLSYMDAMPPAAACEQLAGWQASRALCLVSRQPYLATAEQVRLFWCVLRAEGLCRAGPSRWSRAASKACSVVDTS